MKRSIIMAAFFIQHKARLVCTLAKLGRGCTEAVGKGGLTAQLHPESPSKQPGPVPVNSYINSSGKTAVEQQRS